MREKQQGIPIASLLEVRGLRLVLVAGAEGVSRVIGVAELQKPGLAIAGHFESLHPDRVQVLGYSEISYIATLAPEVARTRLEALCAKGPPCIIVTRSLEVPAFLGACCDQGAMPLLRTSLSSAELLAKLGSFLATQLSPVVSTHGVLVDVYGVGILLLGKSGIGKSEVALDLVLRGHRLVADDIVEIERTASMGLIGEGPEIIKHHMEIRGLGILNIKDLFGVAAVRDTKRIEIVAELADWDENEEYDRLGIDDATHTILGVEVPLIRLPVRPGRNMTTIIEVAARNQLMKMRGHHSAKEFQDRLAQSLAGARARREVADEE